MLKIISNTEEVMGPVFYKRLYTVLELGLQSISYENILNVVLIPSSRSIRCTIHYLHFLAW